MGWAKKQKQKGVAEIEGAVPVHVAGSAAASGEARAESPKRASIRATRASRAKSQASAAPTPAHARQHRKSTLKSGRTIAATREHLETASERQAAHRKARRHQRARLVTVSLIFASIVLCLVVLYFQFTNPSESSVVTPEAEVVYEPTIEIIDEDSATVATTGGSADISSRMRAYIGQAESDFRDLGYTPERAIIPAGSIRQINFYLAGYPGYVKFFLDRGTAESVEDADRLLRYLKSQNITNFEYIDVRLPEKAYWK